MHHKSTTHNLQKSEAANAVKAKSKSSTTFQFADYRSGTIVQRQQQALIQRKPEGKSNKTRLPDQLKMGIEQLSGIAMDDVRVHYNSAKPAQFQAHAYAQGTDIHLAAGQEKHLPHEAWHVVQQKQGRVQPTMQMNGAGVNDDRGLEREADKMGALANANHVNLIQRLKSPEATTVGQQVLQRNPKQGEPVRGRDLANTALKLSGHLIKGTGRILIGLGIMPLGILAPVGAVTITRGVLNGLQAILEGCNLINDSIAYFRGGDQTQAQRYIAAAIYYANKGIAKANSLLGMADLAEAALGGLLDLVRLLFNALIKGLKFLESRRGDRQGKTGITTHFLRLVSRIDGAIENIKEDPIGFAIGAFQKGLEKLNEYRRRRTAQTAGPAASFSYSSARPTGPALMAPRAAAFLQSGARLSAPSPVSYSQQQEDDW